MRSEERKHRILFVDDEAGVLRGLKRSLRKKRKEWDIQFACGGPEALEMMGNQRADIIVSDMQMPDMDGADLLETVRKTYPNTNRIILSGYTKEESILKTVGPAHFYLAKPCSTEEITAAIERLVDLRVYVGNEELRNFSNSIRRLPSIPGIVRELIIELEQEYPSVERVAGLVSHDIALTAQILRLTNSAFFSLPVKATTPLQAVKLLGMDTIRDVILTAGVVGIFRGTREEAAVLERLSNNCLVIGQVAKEICEHWGLAKQECGQAACAGVVSHLGTLLLQTAEHDHYMSAMEKMGQGNADIIEVEEEAFNTNHQKIGAYMLGLWGFALPIIEAVAYHHCPPENLLDKKSPVLAVYIAQTLCKGENWKKEEQQALKDTLDWGVISHLVSKEEFDTWLAFLNDKTG